MSGIVGSMLTLPEVGGHEPTGFETPTARR